MSGLSIPPETPNLYAQDGKGGDAIVYAKYFTPWSGWTWYMTEYDPQERTGFGLVVGLHTELGYFSFDEMEEISGPGGLKIERDAYFEPIPLRAVDECPAWLRNKRAK
jgi:hypothetical protein